MFDCFWCLSLGAAVPITILTVIVAQVSYGWAPLLWLASSTLAVYLEKQILRTQSR